MFKRSILLIPALFGLVALAGCSGSSSSGASTAYAGQYDGTTTITLTGFGETASQTAPLRLIVGVDDRVTAARPESANAGSCSVNPNGTFISGNTATNSATISCSVPGVGTCTITGRIKAVFSNNAVSSNGDYDINCPQGYVKGIETGYLTKTA